MVLAGGATGSLARFLVGTAIMARTGGRFPFGTVFINISGSFLIGLAMTLLTERFRPHPNWRLFLVLGLLNAIGSVALGYAAVCLGAIVAGRR